MGETCPERCMLGKDVFRKERHAGGRSYCGKMQAGGGDADWEGCLL